MEVNLDNVNFEQYKFRFCKFCKSLFKEFRMFYAVLGAVAQLGEHLLCKQGVVGSIPSGSTILGHHHC